MEIEIRTLHYKLTDTSNSFLHEQFIKLKYTSLHKRSSPSEWMNFYPLKLINFYPPEMLPCFSCFLDKVWKILRIHKVKGNVPSFSLNLIFLFPQYMQEKVKSIVGSYTSCSFSSHFKFIRCPTGQIRVDTHMTCMKKTSHPLSIYVWSFSTPFTLDVQF